MNDGHSESRISLELINSCKSLDVSGQVTLEVDNLIPVIKVAQRPVTQIRKSMAAIRNTSYLPADSSTIPDAIRNVCLSSLAVPALSQDSPVSLILVSMENVDLVIDQQTKLLQRGKKPLTSY